MNHFGTPAPPLPSLEQLDRSGALRESFEAIEGSTRRDFLWKGALGGAAFLAALSAPAWAKTPAPSKKNDTLILRFGLTFEHLQAQFYTEGLRIGGFTAETKRWARVIGAHERAHVQIIRHVLGPKAIPSPFFNYHGVTEHELAFTKTAVAMEDLTTALLIGVMPLLDSPALSSALFSLLTVEARHAAWVRHDRGLLPVASAFDEPKTISEVNRLVASTHFMKSTPKTWSKRAPHFTG
jgi:Ferritin-like domain